MEIKCKVSFTLPEDLIVALGIDEDTPIISSVSGNRILLEIADEDIDEDDEIPVKSRWKCDDDCANWWEEDDPNYTDDLYDSFDDDCGASDLLQGKVAGLTITSGSGDVTWIYDAFAWYIHVAERPRSVNRYRWYSRW